MNKHNNNLVTRILLIRHGQSEHNIRHLISDQGDIPLTDKGKEQAKKVAQRLKNEYSIDTLLCSPIYRARQTAEIISEIIEREIILNPDLREFEFGDLSNRSFSDIKETNPNLYNLLIDFMEADSNNRPERPGFPRAETMSDLVNRIKNFTKTMLNEHKGKTVGVVTHGGFIKGFLHYHTGGSFEDYIPWWVDNTAISIIDFYNGNPMIRLFNDFSHCPHPIDFGYPRIL